MFVPDYFDQPEANRAIDFARQNPFGLLITTIDNIPYATHMPFLIEKDSKGIKLVGHFARANSHWKHLSEGVSMAIFHGPHAYVSPTWYADGGVPTWNYETVHAYGHAEMIDDSGQKRNIVETLADVFERDRPDPWVPDYPDSMLNGIVGFSMRVNDLQGKQKLSQNKTSQDFEAVKQHLSESKYEWERQTADIMDSLPKP